MADIVVFGVVAADVVVRVPVLPRAGDQVTGEGLGWRMGGSSANMACGLSSAGHNVRLAGPVGTDAMGDELLAGLSRWGVDTSFVFRVAGPSARTLIILDNTGERAIIGLDDGSENQRFNPEPGPDLSSVDCVYVESYARYPTSIARLSGSALLVTSPPLQGAPSWPADLVVGSETQFDDSVLASPFRSVSAVAGPRLQWVIVTRGSRGADAYGPADHTHVAAPTVTQLDATGAGDAFAAGLIHGLLSEGNIETAMRCAVAWAADSVTRLQSLPSEWAEALARVRPRSLDELG